MTMTETIFFNVPANLFKGIEAVGGRLKITEVELIFTPHKVNIQRAPVSIKIGEIIKVQNRNTMFFFPNGMSVTVKGGSEYKFVVNKRSKLIDHLNQTIIRKRM